MKRFLILLAAFLILLGLVSFASGVRFSVLTFYTSDLQTGAFNVWPILYFRLPLTYSWQVNLEDYVMGTHSTFNIGNVQLMRPTYYYISYRNGGLRAYVGCFKSKHTLTRKMYLLRVGGIYKTINGAELEFKNYTYDVGLNYDWKYSELSAFAGLEGDNYEVYFYVDKGNDLSLSTDMNLSFESGKLTGLLWASMAYKMSLSNISLGVPTFLLGGKGEFGALDFEAQYAYRPNQSAAKIWYDFNDPNKAGYPLQDFNSMITYNLNRRDSVGVLANWNSNISIPTFGIKLSHGDLSLTLGSGDLNGGIGGSQYVTLSYSNYFSIPLTTHPLFSSAERNW